MKKILKVVLEEINGAKGWDYSLQDVYFDFKREILTNELDNAQIEQIKSAVQQTQINTLLNLDTFVERELINQQIAEILDLDYEEIQMYFKDEESPEQELSQITETLENEPLSEAKGGGVIE